MKRTFLILLAAAFLLCGCAAKEGGTESAADVDTSDASSAVSSEEPSSADTSASAAMPAEADMFTARELAADYDERSAVLITLENGTASSASSNVSVDGGRITIKEDGVYIVKGTLEDGQIAVDAPETAKPQIVLDGASVNCKADAALLVLSADKVFVTLAEGSENRLSNAEGFGGALYDGTDGAVFSRSDLSFVGTGSLAIDSPAGHGIVCKDDLVFTGGSFEITCAKTGCDANDSVRVTSASFSITSGGNGIRADNADDAAKGFVYIKDGSFTVTADGDGICASSTLQIKGGDFTVTTGGGSANASKEHTGGGFPGGGRPFGREAESTAEDSAAKSAKGLKATTALYVSGGSFALDCADDALHSNAAMEISGGSFDIKSGDDGMHADDSLNILGGTVNIAESYEGLEALELTVSGGEISVKATDDGLNAAGGVDQSGFGGPMGGDAFGHRGPGGQGGPGQAGGGGSLTVAGGKLYIEASGDGMDANGTLSITGGEVTVCGPTVGDTATLDYDASGTVTGGTFIGTGGAGMAQSFGNGSQPVVAVRVGNIPAGTALSLTDAEGKELLAASPALPYAVVILSAPTLTRGAEYTLTLGSDSFTVTAQ